MHMASHNEGMTTINFDQHAKDLLPFRMTYIIEECIQNAV